MASTPVSMVGFGIVIANRGVQRGSEMHDNTNHVFIIVDGETEFITSGKMSLPMMRKGKLGAS